MWAYHGGRFGTDYYDSLDAKTIAVKISFTASSGVSVIRLRHARNSLTPAKSSGNYRRSTEQRNTVTMGVTATQGSTSDWREVEAQVCDRPKNLTIVRKSRGMHYALSLDPHSVKVLSSRSSLSER